MNINISIKISHLSHRGGERETKRCQSDHTMIIHSVLYSLQRKVCKVCSVNFIV